MTWVPIVEVYCVVCHRMVQGKLDGRAALHYRFNLRDSHLTEDAVVCRGMYRGANVDMTHGMEDSAAAFWPTEPDTYPQPEATDQPPAVSVNSAPGHKFRFVMRSPT